jgi:hypothetical protein
MEIPTKMKSTIVETQNTLIITTPKRKSWILIILFSLYLIQSLYGLIRGLFFEKELIPFELTFILIVCPIIIFFTTKWILWQLKGVKIIEIDSEKLTIKRLSPLRSKIKEYAVKDIKSVNVKDDSVATGPSAMLQLLSIKDPINITFKYGYNTIKTIGGFDFVEASEILELINRKMELK